MATMKYNPDPSLESVALSRDEIVEWLDAGRRLKGLDNRRATTHLLTRVLATVDAGQQTIDSLHAQVGQLQLRAQSRRSLSSTLDPREALRYIDPDELRAHVDGHLRWQLEQVEGRLAAVAGREQAVVAATTHLAGLLAGLAGRDDVPADVTAALTAIVDQLGVPQ